MFKGHRAGFNGHGDIVFVRGFSFRAIETNLTYSLNNPPVLSLHAKLSDETIVPTQLAVRENGKPVVGDFLYSDYTVFFRSANGQKPVMIGSVYLGQGRVQNSLKTADSEGILTPTLQVNFERSKWPDGRTRKIIFDYQEFVKIEERDGADHLFQTREKGSENAQLF